jgi:putative ABC transport system permease protein
MQHKVLALINILSVALGVSVFLSIQIVNSSANKAFEAGVDFVAGRANLEARGNLDDTLLPRMSKTDGVTAATPLVEGLIILPDYPGEYIHLLGVDPITSGPFKTLDLDDLNGAAMDHWFSDPNSIAVTREFADQHRLKSGDVVHGKLGEKSVDLRIGFTLNSGAGASRYAAMDIGWAQELLGMSGKLTSILFRIDDSTHSDRVRSRLSDGLPADIVVQEPEQRSGQVSKMLAGFRLNLSALSLISLLVGVFLIYNTITASVVRRRPEIGILRSLGASQSRVRWLFLSEAILYGAAGTLIGCGGGIVLANYLVRAVAKTITNLYVLVSIDRFYVPLWQTPLVFLVGIGSVLVGAWIPSNAAAKLRPVLALNLGQLIEKSQRPSLIWMVFSFASLVLAGAFGFVALNVNRWGGFASAFFTLAGFCLLAPHITHACGTLVGAVSQRWILLFLASRNLVRSLYRHAMTVAALAAALAMLVGISIMIFSFRKTIDRWVDQRLRADLFISPAANEIVGLQYYVNPELVNFLRSRPEVKSVDTYLSASVVVNGEPVAMGVILGTKGNSPDFVGGNDSKKYEKFWEPGKVMVSEPLSRRLHLHDGDSVNVRTPVGLQAFQVAGIFYDYTKDAGILLIQRQNFERYWKDDRINSIALYLRPGSDPETVSKAIRTGYSKASDYSINTNGSLRKLVVEIFNQTFAVTYVLRFVALFISVFGIVLNTLVLVKEREREMGMLRAVGISSPQLVLLIILEAVLIAIAALIIGLSAGYALSIVLTEVINQAFFGWTIPLSVPWDQLLWIPFWLLPVTILASFVPASRAARTKIIELIRV